LRSSQGDSERGSGSLGSPRSRRSGRNTGGGSGSGGSAGGGGAGGSSGGGDDEDGEEDAARDDAVIWGTTVRVGDATRAFRSFVRGFGAGVPSSSDPHGELAHYQRVSARLERPSRCGPV